MSVSLTKTSQAYVTAHGETITLTAYDNGAQIYRTEVATTAELAAMGTVNGILRRARFLLAANGIDTSGPWCDSPTGALDYRISIRLV